MANPNTTARVLTLNLTSTIDETLSLTPIPQIDSEHIKNETIMNVDVSDNAAIALNKLANVTDSALNIDEYVRDLSDNVANISDPIATEDISGYVSTVAQKFGGAKTFKAVITIDEQQEGGGYNAIPNQSIRPFLVVPNQDLSGVTSLGGAYYKYNLAEAHSLNDYNAFALVAQGIGENTNINTSFYAELTYLSKSEIVADPMAGSSDSTTTKLIITCTGVSLVNTVLGERHSVDNVKVTSFTSGDTFIVVINGIRFASVLLDFYAANNIWTINSLDVSKTLEAENIASNMIQYGFTAINGAGDGDGDEI